MNNLFNLHNLPERLKFATGRIFGTQPLFFPAVILVLGIVFLIPWHMDEFIMFHRIACWYEPQKLNVYHESCLAYPINFLGLDYYRSYIHVGASSSIIFFPVFYFFASPWANYFIGIIILGLTILGLVKSLNLNKSNTILGYLFFPIAFTIIHDGGPTRLSFLSISWTPYLINLIREEKNIFKRQFLVFVCSLSWIISTEDKAFYVFLIPGTFFFTYAAIIFTNESSSVRNLILSTTKYLTAFSFGSFAYLALSKVSGVPYLLYLAENTPSTKSFKADINLLTQDLTSQFNKLVSDFLFLIDWSSYPHRTSELYPLTLGKLIIPFPKSLISFELLPLIVFVFGIGMTIAIYYLVFRSLITKKIKRITIVSHLLVISTLLYWFLAYLPGGGFSHHFAFSQIPLLSAALIACVENVKLLKRLSFIFFGVSAIAIFISVTSVKIDSVSHEIGIVQAVAVKAANSDTVISYSSWGGYMQYSLKNENEIPILNLNNETDFPKIEKYASTNDKEILNICMDCTIELMQNYFKNSAITQIPTSTKVWKVYKVVPNRLDNPE